MSRLASHGLVVALITGVPAGLLLGGLGIAVGLPLVVLSLLLAYMARRRSRHVAETEKIPASQKARGD